MPNPLDTAASIFERLANKEPIGPCDHCGIQLLGQIVISDDGAQLCGDCASAIARPATVLEEVRR